MSNKVPLKNPVRNWVEFYNKILEEKYNSNVRDLMNDKVGMYILRRLLDLIVEDCSGVRYLPLKPSDEYYKYGELGDLKNYDNNKNMESSLLARMLFFSYLKTFIDENLYNNDSDVSYNRKEINELLWKISYNSKYISELEKDNKKIIDIDSLIDEYPTAYCRGTYATSLLAKENIEEFQKFSNNFIWEHSSGSGYNAWLCKQMGINIYCTDHKDNYFKNEYIDDKRYANVHDEISDEEVKNIIKNDGAMMYIWPLKKYHDLEKWIKLGGKKIIIVADHNPDHVYIFKKIKELHEKPRASGKKIYEIGDGIIKEIAKNAPLICPKFPYENEWKLVNTMEVPHYNESIQDYSQFWIRK